MLCHTVFCFVWKYVEGSLVKFVVQLVERFFNNKLKLGLKVFNDRILVRIMGQEHFKLIDGVF